MLPLPTFKPNLEQRAWIAHHRVTADIIHLMWSAASSATRREAGFLATLLRATWVGSTHQSDHTRLTRNRHWSDWLRVENWRNEEMLSGALADRLPGLSRRSARWIVRTQTGITLYYAAVRPNTVAYVQRHRKRICTAIQRVTREASDAHQKVRAVAAILEDLPQIQMPAGGQISCFNGLSPLFACLDPQRRFPIMNKRTQSLLRVLDVDQNADGAAALADLMGKRNIRDSMELDVYAYTQFHRISRVARDIRSRRLIQASPAAAKLRTLGHKNEEHGVAHLAKTLRRVRRLHNELTNRFENVVRWKHILQESAVDILIERWRGDRWLLIEAKTSSSGPGGRVQLRQAIGQLFDYRRMQFPKATRRVDLALLTPTKPSPDVLGLLQSLKIHALWFNARRLNGTIRL